MRVQGLPAQQLIVDGEAIALRPDGAPYPFQDTMRRFGRVLEIDHMRATMPLSLFLFDCLHLNGEDLVSRLGSERIAALSSVVPPHMLVPRITTSDPAIAQAFYDDAVRRQHEGVMVKSPTRCTSRAAVALRG